MSDMVLPSRYAQAFWEYLRERDHLTDGVQQLLDFQPVLSDNPDFREFLESPEVGDREKFQVVDRVTGRNFLVEINHFIKLLIEKDRVHYLSDIIEYVRVNYGCGDKTPAVLASVFPLDDDEVSKIKETLERRIRRRIDLSVTRDAQLLGGVKVTIGHHVFDGSLKRQLEELRAKAMNRRV